MTTLVNKIKSKIYLSNNELVVKAYIPYYSIRNRKLGKKPKEDYYINHNRKILFIHNPKAAGKSIKKQLGLNYDGANHRTPTFLVDKKIWENYFSIVAVRHPIERLISSFNYHTKKEYTGNYYKKYPFLHRLNFEEYFHLFKHEPWAIRPQTDYLKHFQSDKKIDFIIRFENLQQDMNSLCSLLRIPVAETPFINSSPKKFTENELKNNTKLAKEIIDFYQNDFDILDYAPYL